MQASEAVVVTFGATLQQIQKFDEEAGTITTNVWLVAKSSYRCFHHHFQFRLSYEWNDPRLAWNESHANGIRDVRLNIKVDNCLLQQVENKTIKVFEHKGHLASRH